MSTQIINYSERAIAVVGDTKPIKDQLKSLGGRFNGKLTCGPGWIFSISRRPQVEQLLSREPTTKAEKPEMDGWKIYVGTYAKYNSGSIAGAWLTLSDYANKDEFLAACRKLHKDEADPEFMFQDAENIPSWLWGESFVDAAIWSYKEPKEKDVQSAAEKRAILEKYIKPIYLEEEIKDTSVCLEVNGRYYAIEKPTIQTRFCHPDEPEEEVKAWYKVCHTYEYFERENLADFDRKIELIQREDAYICEGEGYRTLAGVKESWIARPYCGRKDDKAADLDDETRRAVLAAYKTARKMFQKRLQTWWKRYGADKLYCWTYWRDA